MQEGDPEAERTRPGLLVDDLGALARQAAESSFTFSTSRATWCMPGPGA